MQRVVRPELLDTDLGTPNEIAASLADLRRVNRWFGGVATTVATLERVAQHTGRRQFSMLDVGAGSGEVTAHVQEALAGRGIQLEPTLLDRKHSHLALGTNHVRRIAADALSLPFRDSWFDVVGSNLFAHHLEPEELIRFLQEALRVSRVAVMINDLRRSAASLALVYAGFPLFRSRLSRHDGVASVRRSYTAQEMRSMLEHIPGQSEIRHHFLFRLSALVWKN